MKLIDNVINRFEHKYKEENTPWVRDEKNPTGLKEFVNELKKHKKQAKILDIGCGEGWIARKLAKEDFFVTGVDSSKTAIKKAKEKNKGEKNPKFIIGNALDFPFPDNSFDAVIDRGLLHHIPEKNWHSYKKGIKRVLKNGGLYYLAVFSDDSIKKDFNPKKEKKVWNKVKDKSGYWTYDHFFNKETIQKFVGNQFELLWQGEDKKPTPNGSILIYSIFRIL